MTYINHKYSKIKGIYHPWFDIDKDYLIMSTIDIMYKQDHKKEWQILLHSYTYFFTEHPYKFMNALTTNAMIMGTKTIVWFI